MTSVAIRTYTDSDLESCRKLWVELTQHHRDIYGDQTIGGDDPGHYFDDHLAKVGAENVFLAVDGAAVVGMAGLEKSGDGWLVEPAVVARDRRRGGIGRTLLAAVVKAARERRLNSLCVKPVARNASAISFFRDAGFDKLGEVYLYIDFGGLDKIGWKRGVRLGEEEFEY
ncbi:MAG: GNAT family N-acetyltransferase [Methanobacteriota archaeon]